MVENNGTGAEREIGGYKKGERLRLSVIARHGVRPGPKEVTDYSCSQKGKGFRVTLQDPKTSHENNQVAIPS